ncbi:hypothetical protein N7507_005733 [Penicillium longicatenatum]|nr:hypothetical protein N7507_005733 [Penicillium longicatenatum]
MPTDIKTKLTYLHWQPTYTQTRPYRIAQFGSKKKNDEQAHNLVFRKGEFAETIHDIRGVNEDTKYTLETNGFVYARHPPPIFTQPKDFLDPDQVRNVFLPECEAILRKEIEGVERVFIFDWKIRKKKSAKERRTRNPNLLKFARQVHVDTLLTRDELKTSLTERIRNHLPKESHHLLTGRVQMINIWRPIGGPVEDDPITVCDGRTFDTSKLVETDMIRGDYNGTLMYPLYDPSHACRWYYMSRQDVEDVLLFKSFDSKEGSVKHVPHTSFSMPDVLEDAPSRISVEQDCFMHI